MPFGFSPAPYAHSQECATYRCWMKRRDLIAAYGRLCLVLAAFALIVGIVGAPLLPRIWSPAAVVAQR